MKKVIVIAIFAFILGGFIGGNLIDHKFSIINGIISGIVGLIIFNIFFIRKRRVINNSYGKTMIDNYVNLAENIVNLAFIPCLISPKDAVSNLLANNCALGYIFGIHDCLLQRTKLTNVLNKDKLVELIELSYMNIFGDYEASILVSASIDAQEDEDFLEGQIMGGNEYIKYIEQAIPMMGLTRIFLLETKN